MRILVILGLLAVVVLLLWARLRKGPRR